MNLSAQFAPEPPRGLTAGRNRTFDWNSTSPREDPRMPHGLTLCLAKDAGGTERLLIDDSPTHLLAFGPVGSGRSTALAYPTLYAWRGSAIVNDPGGELWAMTSGHRAKAMGQRILTFNPLGDDPSMPGSYDLLAGVRIADFKSAVKDASAIAGGILRRPNPGASGVAVAIDRNAKSLLAGVMLHLLLKARCAGAPPPNMADVVEFIFKGSERTVKEFEAEMLVQESTLFKPDERPMTRLRRQSGDEAIMSLAFRAVEGVLRQCAHERFRGNVSRCDWTADDLVADGPPCTVYLISERRTMFQSKERHGSESVCRAVLSQVIQRLSERPPRQGDARSSECGLLMLMEDFDDLGRVDELTAALPNLSAAGVRCHLSTTDIDRLRSVYGDDAGVFEEHCGIKLFLPPNRIQQAAYMHQLVPTLSARDAMRQRGNKIQAHRDSPMRTVVESGDMLVTANDHFHMGTIPHYFMDQRQLKWSKTAPVPQRTVH